MVRGQIGLKGRRQAEDREQFSLCTCVSVFFGTQTLQVGGPYFPSDLLSCFILPSCLQGKQATPGGVPEIGGDGTHPGHLCRGTCCPHPPPGGHHCHHP